MLLTSINNPLPEVVISLWKDLCVKNLGTWHSGGLIATDWELIVIRLAIAEQTDCCYEFQNRSFGIGVVGM
jgi:hypothetical protein